MKTKMLYRVTFTYLNNVAGNMVWSKGSTMWFSSLDEAKGSRWMREENAKIEAREIAV